VKLDLKPIIWMGSSREALRNFPEGVRRDIGQALYTAQQGETDPAAKPLKGFGGARVMEIVDRHDTNTYRTVYTVQFAGTIYVPHAFQKEIKEGHSDAAEGHRADPATAGRGRAELQRKAELMMKKNRRVRAEEGSGNVFADLELPHAEQELLKARLTLQIYKIIKARGLTQAKAGDILGIKQPHVSALMRNRAGMFSVERLMEFLTNLGQDIEITVRPTRKEHGEVSVVVAA